TNAQTKELSSVSYHRSGMRFDDCTDIRVNKTADTYTLVFETGRDENNTISFEIEKSDFDELSTIVFGMSKPRKERHGYVRDLMKSLQVSFIKNGKTVYLNYSINQRKDKKTAELEKQAVDLMYKWIDRYKKQFEIRFNYSKGIATPTEIVAHAEPADLVEDLGVFTERLDPDSDIQCGGRNDYSHRWRALKPGIVTVWLHEVSLGDDVVSNFTKDYEPSACYIIDENLHVRYSKEETLAAQERFKKQQKYNRRTE
ncbi:MAG: hypothetical protein GXY75_03800, partial [Bacteroidales bacterium]|nr:hypothetical protein [Bacteroidales bacterium]